MDMPQQPPRTRRAGAAAAAVRDAEALAHAIAQSGMSRRRVAVSTQALYLYKPGIYDSVSYQTLNNLASGKQVVTSIARAQAIEEALRMTPGSLFTIELELVNDQKKTA